MLRPLALALCLLVAAAPVAVGGPSDRAPDRVVERFYDDDGRLVWERGVASQDDGVEFWRHFTHAPAAARNQGGGRGGGGVDLGTGCQPDSYRLGGWEWSAPYSVHVDSYSAQFSQAGDVWDAETAADIFGAVIADVAGVAGTRDGVNQIQFVDLGGGSTIAVTTTWYNTFTGAALESDGEYNTAYPWSTAGAVNAMDVVNIAVHELGHTVGLLHPNGKQTSISCLSMYAYANYGETQKRTLGDGDILGLEAIYGA